MTGVIACIGEPLVVLAPPTGRRLADGGPLSVSVGGAEANVAVHLARLGLPVRFVAALGSDPFGDLIAATLADAGVDTDGLVRDATRPTGIYAKDPQTGGGTGVYYYRSGSAAAALRSLAPAALTGVDHVHVTGILPALSADCAALTTEVVGSGRQHTVSFDINLRPSLWPTISDAAIALEPLAAAADIVFGGLDEAAELWSCGSADEVRRRLPDVELVIKNGGEAATAFVGRERFSADALPTEVVEPVGAGDGFAAGYLAARRHGDDPLTALRVGHAVAASVLRTPGDQGSGPDAEVLAAARGGHSWPTTAPTTEK